MKIGEKRAKWQSLSSKVVWTNRLNLIEHVVRLPNGEKTTYIVNHGSGAVATLISLGDGKILLTYQYRFPLDKWIYDLPGGGLRSGETPDIAAIRECEEETGLRPTKLIPLVTFSPNPSRADWPVYIFFCSTYHRKGSKQDEPSEKVECTEISVSRLERLIKKGRIIDPALLIAWFFARSRRLI